MISLGTAVALLAMVSWDAHRRTQVAVQASGRLQGFARIAGCELALYGGARWLRHPLRSEPRAYGHDGPSVPDIDPGGAIIRPTRLHRFRVARAR